MEPTSLSVYACVCPAVCPLPAISQKPVKQELCVYLCVCIVYVSVCLYSVYIYICVCPPVCPWPAKSQKPVKQKLSNLTRWLPQSWQCITYRYLAAFILIYTRACPAKLLFERAFCVRASHVNDACTHKWRQTKMFPFQWNTDSAADNWRRIREDLVKFQSKYSKPLQCTLSWVSQYSL